MAGESRSKEGLRVRMLKRALDYVMPGEVKKQALSLAVQRHIKHTRAATANKPDPDQSGYLSFKSEGDTFSHIARHSRNDVIVSRSQDGSRILWRRRIKPQVLNGIYDLISWINAAVNEIEKWVNQEGWDIVDDGTGQGKPEDRQRALDFFEAPNSDGDYIEDIIGDMVIDSYVLGDHFTELGRVDGTGELAELATIAGETVFIETDKDGNITSYVQRDAFSRREIGRMDPADVMQFRRNARGRGLFGASILKALLLAVEADANSQTWNRDQFKNDNASRNAWIFPQDTSTQSMDANETTITGARGPGGTHQDIVLRAAGGEIQIKSLNVKPADMEFEKLRKMSREEFLAVIGVPPMLVGVLEAGSIGTGSGKEQIRIFVRGTVMAIQFRIARLFTHRIMKVELSIFGFKFKFNTDDLIDEKDRAETEKIYVDSGIKTVDEARENIGLRPLDEMMEEDVDLQERKIGKSLSSATGTTEIVPIPGAPLINPAVHKLKAGILQVLRRWRSRVNLRIKQTLSKQEFGMDDFEEDIRSRDMELVLAAGLATAARAGLRQGRSLGGDPSDEALARTRPISQIRAQELAGTIASDISTQISDVIAVGTEAGLGPNEIAKEILEVFDEPRVIDVAESLGSEGQVIRAAHTRSISAETWAETTARTQASEVATEASLTSFEAAQIAAVVWRTARFRVDQKICAKVDGRIFNLQDARAAKLIPAHPNCRCHWEPAPPDAVVNGTPAEVQLLRAEHGMRISCRIAKQGRRRHENDAQK